MSERSLIIVAGLLGAGKTSVVNGLVENYGFEARGVGDELARLYQVEHGLPSNSPVPGLERMRIHKKVRKLDPTYFSRFLLRGECDIVADGLRNYLDAQDIVRVGGKVITLVAPRPLRLFRRLGLDIIKDPTMEAMVTREITELYDPDPDGSQALKVMALAFEHGALIDASRSDKQVFSDVVVALENHKSLPA